jgi:hypothetical protein
MHPNNQTIASKECQVSLAGYARGKNYAGSENWFEGQLDRSGRNASGVHFGNLSKKELGQLFDKYRLTGRLDIRWNDRTGEYVVSIFE